MSNFIRILKMIGRAILRAACAVGRFFKFLFKRIGKSFKTNKQKKIIRKNEGKIQKLFTEIGRSYFEAHEGDPEPLLAELCADVSVSDAAVATAEETIRSLKDTFDSDKAAAKEKAKARREADKAKAKAEKSALRGEPADEADPEPIAETPVSASRTEPDFIAPEPEITSEPEPVFVAPEPELTLEPDPAFVAPEPELTLEPDPAFAAPDPAPVPEPEPAAEVPFEPSAEPETKEPETVV